MRKTVVFIGLCLSSCGLQLSPGGGALFDGQLNDMTGFWTISQVKDALGGVQQSCANTKFKVIETPPSISMGVRNFSCANGAYEVSWQDVILQVSGETLSFNGIAVGTKGGNTLNFSIPTGGGAVWTFSIYSVGGVLKYSESTTGRSTITGTLSKSL